MSFWTEVVRPLMKVAVAAWAAYTGNFGLAVTLLSAGVQDAQKQRLRKQGRDAANASARDRQQMVMSATNARQDVYGRVVVSGTVLLRHSAGAKKEFLYIAVELARHEIDGVESIWIGDQEILASQWDAAGNVMSGPFCKSQSQTATVGRTGPGTIAVPNAPARIVSAIRQQQGEPVDVTALCTFAGSTITVGGAAHADRVDVTYEWSTGRPLVRVLLALGSPTQSAFAAWQSEIPDIWTPAHRLRGRAAVGLRIEYDQDVFGSMRDINIKAKVRGKRLYDPRTGTTAWTRNPVLIAADYKRVNMGALTAHIRDSELAAEASICDEYIPTGATPPAEVMQSRYTCDLAISTAIAPRDALAMILETMAGTCVWVQGRWMIRAGAWRAPSLTLTAADLAQGPVTISPTVPRRQLCNSVVATYCEPGQGWAMVPAPEVRNAMYLAQDGGYELPMQISLEGVQDAVRAQRLARVELERTRAGGVMSARWSSAAYDAVPGGTVAISIPRYFGSLVKVFEVTERRLDLATLEIDLALRETAAGVWEWHGGMATQVDLTPNTSLPNPLAVVAPLVLSPAVSGNTTMLRLADGTIIARVLLAWAQHANAFVLRGGRIEVAWRRVTDAEWIPAPALPGDATETLVGPVDDLAAILLRARAVNAAGRASEWSTVAHIAQGKSAAPTAPTALAVSETPAAARRFVVSHQPDVDHAGYELRYSAALAAGWAQMSLLDAWTGGPVRELSLPADGTWRFGVIAIDSSGNSSAPVYAQATLSGIAALAAGGAVAGGNVVPNSDFGMGVSGWSWGFTNGAVLTVTDERSRDPASTILPVGVNALVMWQAAPIAGGDAVVVGGSWPTDAHPASPGERWGASVLYASHRCRAFLTIEWRDAVGNLTSNVFSLDQQMPPGGVYLSGWRRLEIFDTAPAGTVSVRFAFVKRNTLAGQSDSFAWLLHPQLRRVDDAAVSMPDYASGPLGYTGDIDATRGAPTGTPIGDRLVEDLLLGHDAIVRDDQISPAEKPRLIRDWSAIASERPLLVAEANRYAITTERDAYTTAVDALAAYLGGLVPAWDNVALITPIVAATSQARWSAVATTRAALRQRIDAQAGTRVFESGQLALGAAAQVYTVSGQMAFVAGQGSGFATGWITIPIETGDSLEFDLLMTNCFLQSPDPDIELAGSLSWRFSDQTISYSSQSTSESSLIQTPVPGALVKVDSQVFVRLLKTPLTREQNINPSGVRTGDVQFRYFVGCYAGYTNRLRAATEIEMYASYYAKFVRIRR